MALRLQQAQWRTKEFCSGGGGCSTNSVEDRENGDLEAAEIWYKKISFHIIKFS